MGSILYFQALIEKAQIDLIDQRGTLQGMPFAFPVQVMARQVVKLGIDQGDQSIQGLGFSILPTNQEFRDPI